MLFLLGLEEFQRVLARAEAPPTGDHITGTPTGRYRFVYRTAESLSLSLSFAETPGFTEHTRTGNIHMIRRAEASEGPSGKQLLLLLG